MDCTPSSLKERIVAMGIESIKSNENVDLVAFYLPQYYQTEYNDAWWGKGFTEWTNVASATPVFENHYQPRIPADMGFYDTTAPGTIEKQVTLAKQFGISSFCFYHYWFNGERLLDKPLAQFMDLNLGFPFLISWANENWTANWDGGDRQVLKEQLYEPGFETRFIQDSLPILTHEDYLCDNGVPILVVYRPEDFPTPKENIARLRESAINLGLKGLRILAVKSFGTSDPREIGADGLIELPPLHFSHASSTQPIKLLKNWNGGLLDMGRTALSSVNRDHEDFRLYRGVMPSWDNTPRRNLDSTVFVGESPELFRLWLAHQIIWEKAEASIRGDKKMVFINAWNEWAEGAHLEPDKKYGLDWLQAAKDARDLSDANPDIHLLKSAIWSEANKFENGSNDGLAGSPERLLSLGYVKAVINLLKDDLTGKKLFLAAKSYITRRFTTHPKVWYPAANKILPAGKDFSDWSKLLIHAHIHYEEFFGDLTSQIKTFPTDVKWIISSSSREILDKLRSQVASENVRFVEVVNRGRNFGALFQAAKEFGTQNYILHVHSKKSPHMDKARARNWSNTLWSGLLDVDKVKYVLGLMESEPEVELFFPTVEQELPSIGYSWTTNVNQAIFLCRKLHIPFLNVKFPYPAGGMFLARRSLLDLLLSLNMTLDEMPAEPLPLDGSLAHAIERLVGYLPFVRGKKQLVLSTSGVMTTDTSFVDHPTLFD